MSLIKLNTDIKKKKLINVGNYNLYNIKSNLTYCRIPKNACTTLRFTFIKNLDDIYEFPGSSDFEKLKNVEANPSLLSNIGKEKKRDAKIKLLILRNPYDRIVSAFLDRFCKGKDQMYEVVDQKLRLSKKYKDIDFDFFLENLISTNYFLKNVHYIPQNEFTFDFDYNFVFNIKKLNDEKFIKLFEEKTKLKFFDSKKVKDHTLSSLYKENFNHANKLKCKLLRKMIKEDKKIPYYENFLTLENKRIIYDIYKKDFKLFEKYGLEI